MPMLTDEIAAGAAPRSKPYKLYDETGLYLHVAPTGTRTWRLKYRRGGRERLHVLGRYPHITLGRAREIAQDTRPSLHKGILPLCDLKRMITGLPHDYDGQLRSLAALPCTGKRRIYFIQVGNEGPMKLGISANPKQRLAQIQTHNFEMVHLRGTMPGTDIHESLIHHIFSEERLHGEWFQPSARLLAFIETL